MMMAGSNTQQQYLQVPKALPHRKAARSRSKSRSPSPTPAAEGGGGLIVSPPRSRPTSPPVPGNQTSWKPTLKGFITPVILTKPPPLPIVSTPPAGDAPLCVMDISMTDAPPPPSPPAVTSRNDMPKLISSGGTNYDDLNGDLYSTEATNPPTPPPEPPLRDRLIGAWKLESYTAYPTPTSTVQRPTYPMTKNVTGLILYTPDGYVSAQMLIPGQQSFKRGEGAEPQWAEAAKRSFTYCGPYYITDEGPGREEILRHTFQACNLPGWIGDIQVRTCRFEEEGQVLVLGSEEPTEIKGDKRIPVLKWRRARDNRTGVPPPPMPQIKISGPGEP